MKQKIIDTHAHLTKENYGSDLEEILIETSNNLMLTLNIGTNLETNYEVIDISKKFNNIKPIIGIHPNESNELDLKILEELEKMIIENEILAIGEIGLDYHYEHNKSNQKEMFERQIEIARRHKLPIIIHLRDAFEDGYEILQKYDDVKFLIHSWSGDQELTKKFLTHKNFWFSFNGIITFKNGTPQKEVIKIIPKDKILFETDCPYLAPNPFRGRKNKPLFVNEVILEASKILGMNFENINVMNRDNLKEFLK